jgi:hypothetical protein
MGAEQSLASWQHSGSSGPRERCLGRAELRNCMSPLVGGQGQPDSGHEFPFRNVTQGLTPVRRSLAVRMAASMRSVVPAEQACRRRCLVKGGVIAVVCALIIAWGITVFPGVAQAQTACNVTDEFPEVVDVRIVGSRVVRLYIWQTKHIFHMETAPAYFATSDEKKIATHCFARACHQLSQTTLATSWTAARKLRAVFS